MIAVDAASAVDRNDHDGAARLVLEARAAPDLVPGEAALAMMSIRTINDHVRRIDKSIDLRIGKDRGILDLAELQRTHAQYHRGQRRAQDLGIREFVAGLERIHSHLLWLGVTAHEAGFDTLFMYSWRDRETVMDILEALSGNRVHYSANVLGGVKFDLTDASSLLRTGRADLPYDVGDATDRR